MLHCFSLLQFCFRWAKRKQKTLPLLPFKKTRHAFPHFLFNNNTNLRYPLCLLRRRTRELDQVLQLVFSGQRRGGEGVQPGHEGVVEELAPVLFKEIESESFDTFGSERMREIVG